MAKSSSEVQLLELKDTISQLNTTIKMLDETINRQQKESDNLKAELAWFRQKMFGASSERRIDDFEGQLSLFDEMDEFDKPIELIEPEIIEIQKHTRKKKPSLEEQFKDIPTRQVLADTLTDEDKICPECGSEMLAIGTEKKSEFCIVNMGCIFFYIVRKRTFFNRQHLLEELPWRVGLFNPVRCTYNLCTIISIVNY